MARFPDEQITVINRKSLNNGLRTTDICDSMAAQVKKFTVLVKEDLEKLNNGRRTKIRRKSLKENTKHGLASSNEQHWTKLEHKHK